VKRRTAWTLPTYALSSLAEVRRRDRRCSRARARGTIDPVGLSFDLNKADRVRAKRTDPTNPDKLLPQFEQGFVINLKENEPVSTQVSVQLPDDRITWHFEADIYVGGEKRTIVLDDGGRDFYSPGVRSKSEPYPYSEGHFNGVEHKSWGIDRAAKLSGNWLEYPGLRIPWMDGIDIYQPNLYSAEFSGYRWMVRDAGYRWIRIEGRQLVRFNPPGVAADEPTLGERTTPLAGSDVMLITAAGLAATDQSLADRIVKEATAIPTSVPLLTQEPVATLPDQFRPALAGAELATDVGYITELYADTRGVVLQFDKVTYRRCSCPSGGEVVNDNPKVRTFVLTENATVTRNLHYVRNAHILVAISRTPSGEVTSLIAQEP
jgi:hypothetical protein